MKLILLVVRVFVFHYNNKLPTQISPDVAKKLKDAITDFLSKNPDVKYNGTWWNPNTGVGICDWEGPKEKELKK